MPHDVAFLADLPVVAFLADLQHVSFLADLPVVAFLADLQHVSFLADLPVVAFLAEPRTHGSNLPRVIHLGRFRFFNFRAVT
ncbi:hypothetical protein [Peribacillus sp. SCS-155]|uniref:hypothetical protein n=1 Tax=Peribacillus sedimenti TaxID=3115297 RepID=UPI0039058E42